MIELLEKTNLLHLFEANKLDGIAHQTNIEKRMGAGIARDIAQSFPWALQALQASQGQLGEVTSCKVEHGWIYNASAQSLAGIGRKTNYEAFYRCFELIEMSVRRQKDNFRLGVPFMIGCGLGGGSWVIISAILTEIFKESTVKLIICNKD